MTAAFGPLQGAEELLKPAFLMQREAVELQAALLAIHPPDFGQIHLQGRVLRRQLAGLPHFLGQDFVNQRLVLQLTFCSGGL